MITTRGYIVLIHYYTHVYLLSVMGMQERLKYLREIWRLSGQHKFQKITPLLVIMSYSSSKQSLMGIFLQIVDHFVPFRVLACLGF